MTALKIVRDLLVVEWDGKLPPGVPQAAIHNKSDIVYFWEHLKDFARYNEKFDGFLLDFSVQNLRRIHAQFGSDLLVKGERFRIDELKRRQGYFRGMLELSMRVKGGQLEIPVSYKKDPLGPYQHIGVMLLMLIERFPLFADCGMGKTFMVLVSTWNQIVNGSLPRGKTLIAVKLPTIETGWLEDCEQFTDLKIQSLWFPPMSAKGGVRGPERRRQAVLDGLQSDADLFVINHEGIINYEGALAAHRFQKVVVDESTILKGFHGTEKRFQGGVFGRALLNVARHAQWRVVMSGTPAPNGPQDLWGQMHFLDPDGFLLEPTWHDFKKSYMNEITFGKAKVEGKGTPAKLVPKPGTIEKINKLISPAVYRLRIRDHLKDLPDLTVQRRLVDMTPTQKRHYGEMKSAMSTIIDDRFVAVDMKLTQMLKLRQITGGFLKDDQEVDHALPENPKLQALDDLVLSEIDRDLKIVIFAQYRWEISTIEERYKDQGTVSVYGANAAEKNLAAIKRFRSDPTCRIIVLHPQSAAHGVTLTVAHHLIFYSISHSEEQNYQGIKRIDRAGQKSKMAVYYLLAKDSIDTLIYDVLLKKKRDQEQLLDQSKVDEALVLAMQGEIAA